LLHRQNLRQLIAYTFKGADTHENPECGKWLSPCHLQIGETVYLRLKQARALQRIVPLSEQQAFMRRLLIQTHEYLGNPWLYRDRQRNRHRYPALDQSITVDSDCASDTDGERLGIYSILEVEFCVRDARRAKTLR